MLETIDPKKWDFGGSRRADIPELQKRLNAHIGQPHPLLRLKAARIPERFWEPLQLPPEMKQLRHPDQARALHDLVPDALDRLWDTYEDTAKADGISLKKLLMAWVDEYPEHEKGIVLLGPAGRGKTMGLCTLLTHIALAHQTVVKYIPFAELVLMKQQLIHLDRASDEPGADPTEYHKVLFELGVLEQGCDVLLVDDVGKEYRGSGSRYSDDYLDRLLRDRHDRGLTTLLSSNLTASEFKSYNESMASFVHEVGDVFTVLSEKDRRVRKSSMRDRLEKEDTSARPSRHSRRVS